MSINITRTLPLIGAICTACLFPLSRAAITLIHYSNNTLQQHTSTFPTYNLFGVPKESNNITGVVVAPSFSKNVPCALEQNATDSVPLLPTESGENVTSVIVLVHQNQANYAHCTSLSKVSHWRVTCAQ
jgi:hypothetical protein